MSFKINVRYDNSCPESGEGWVKVSLSKNGVSQDWLIPDCEEALIDQQLQSYAFALPGAEIEFGEGTQAIERRFVEWSARFRPSEMPEPRRGVMRSLANTVHAAARKETKP